MENDDNRKRYTLSVLSENTPGVLHRITSVFTRRSVNIESLTVSETEKAGISRFTVVFLAESSHVPRLLEPVRRMVEVVDAVAHEDGQLLFKEIAFLRAGFASQDELELLRRRAEDLEARCVLVNGRSVVFEKTGTEEEIDLFKRSFRTHRILAFIRSGRIAIERQAEDLLAEELKQEGSG
jgi:acetolactate synthase I/III small subunit